ncbi:MAG: bifunctional histidinol-phosphatase/imidazoleglycerol-phosphate dehydratase HisB [Bacteroidia bacterium]|nr:bifunctional histidinol-phosphatase/imidazoleglycerol-phosphate dehydratase HisB [Bacteroidia bacterium]
MKKVLFLDRDGAIIVEPPIDFQVDSLEKLEFLPGVIRNLYRIRQVTDFEWVMVTNQDGLGTKNFPEETFWPAHNKMLKTLSGEGITFSEIIIDRTFAHEGSPTRKPGTALLTQYLTGDYDLANSLVIGDRFSDMLLARNLGAKGILLGRSGDSQDSVYEGNDLSDTIIFKAENWEQVGDFVVSGEGRRKATLHRKTNETDITVTLDLDGRGVTQNATGLGFLDHMLDQLGKHSRTDLTVNAKGDIHIDEHHTIEDVAITLGEVFRKALGDKRGIERYGCFDLVMDDALARVAIDFSGRPWLVWKADFGREKVGDMPVEMVYHFFKSFSDAARCNLNVEITGNNAHHMIEATFKGVARAIRNAIQRIPGEDGLPTTKGLL